jgi:hypothetical protein
VVSDSCLLRWEGSAASEGAGCVWRQLLPAVSVCGARCISPRRLACAISRRPCPLLPAPALPCPPLPRSPCPRHASAAPVCSRHAPTPRPAPRAPRYTPLMLIISSLTRPYPCPSTTLTPRTSARFSLSSRSSLRAPPCVTPLTPQSLTLRTQHLSHPHPLSRCASHFTPFTPLPGLQIHCPATHLLSRSLLLRPQFFGMTPLTCPFTLLLCSAAGTICAS